MRLIILILCISKSLASFESSNEDGKYIDLLPDEEKREFLDRVARRILAQVKTKEIPYRGKSSVEIPDDQLDKHNEFVNKILEEESKNLRTGRDSEKEGSKEKRGTQDVIGNNLTVANRNDNDEHYIDLTLRQGMRQKRNSSVDTETIESTTETRYVEIPVKTVYDDKNNANVTKDSQPLKHEDNDNMYKTDTDIQVRGVKRSSRQTVSNSEIQIPVKVVQSNEEKSNLQVMGIRSDVITEKSVDTTTILNNDEDHIFTDNPNTSNASMKNSEEVTEKSAESSIDNSVLITSTTLSNLETDTTATEMDKNDINNLKENNTHFITQDYHIVNDSDNTNNKNEVTLKNDPYTDKNIEDTSVTLLNESTSSTFLNANNETNFSKEEITPSKLLTEETTSHVTEISDVVTLESNTENKDNSPYKIYRPNKEKEVTSTTEIMPITKFIFMSSTPKTVKAQKTLKYVIKQEITDKSTYDVEDNTNLNIASNIINALRQRIDIDETKDDNVRRLSYDIKQTREQTINTYQVYEIKPGQVPFVKRQVKPKKQKQEDRQYYAPVYNYSPNNAYYYPYNKFGPNHDLDEPVDSSVYMPYMYYNDQYIPMTYKEDNIANKRKFSFKMSKQKYRDRNPYAKLKHNRKPYQLILPPVPIKRKPAEIFIDNYLDGDYYFNGEDLIDTSYVTGNRFQNFDEHEFVDDGENFRKTLKMSSISNSESYLSNTNLKDHLRSVRKKLEKKKYGYHNQLGNEREVNVGLGKRYDIFKLLKPVRKRSDHNPKSSNPNSISEDYFFGSEKAKNLITRVANNMLPSIQRSNPYRFIKNHWGRWPKPKRNEKHMDVSATSYPIKHEYDIVNKMLPILQTNDLEYKVKYSENKKEITPNTDYNFVLQNVDNLLGPPKADDEISAFVIAMQNLLNDKSKALQEYNWLETTVKIQSAIDKLSDMTDNLLNGIDLHPADLELLKYTTFLHTVAKHELEKKYTTHRLDITQRSKKQHKSPLPRNKRKPKHNIVKTKGLIERVWLYRAKIDVIAKYDLYDFVQFLVDLQNSLYDLHNALKHISLITTYKNQRWLENLIDLYLNDVKTKQHLELILHLATVRLIDLVEESSKNGMEDNFMVYVQKNGKIVRRSIEEFIFVKRLLEEIKKL